MSSANSHIFCNLGYILRNTIVLYVLCKLSHLLQHRLYPQKSSRVMSSANCHIFCKLSHLLQLRLYPQKSSLVMSSANYHIFCKLVITSDANWFHGRNHRAICLEARSRNKVCLCTSFLGTIGNSLKLYTTFTCNLKWCKNKENIKWKKTILSNQPIDSEEFYRGACASTVCKLAEEYLRSQQSQRALAFLFGRS